MEVTDPVKPEVTEKTWFRICRIIVGIAMFMESFFLAMLAFLILIIGSLVTLLTFGAALGALALLASGSLIVVLPVFASVNLLQRSRPRLTSFACAVLVILEGVLMFIYKEDFRMYSLIVPAVPFAAIFIAWNMKPVRPFTIPHTPSSNLSKELLQ